MKTVAESLFMAEDYIAAYPVLDSIHNMEPNDVSVVFMLGVCEMKHKKNYSRAINYFEFVKINSTKAEIPPQLYVLLGDAYHLNYNFDNAIRNYEEYKGVFSDVDVMSEDIDRKITIANYAQELFNKSVKCEKINLGQNINSDKNDYAPVISADETTLIFTSRREGGVNPELAFDGSPFEDIYVSEKDENNTWSKARLMNNKINTLHHDATTSITSDGQKLFLYRSGKNGKEGAIYESRLNGAEWGTPTPLGSTINSKDWVSSVTITPDEQTLYFTSNKKGGLGGKDIYVSQKMDDGSWSEAKHLGDVINTAYDEESPFIHPDGKTLFFSSKGHSTMGGYDIFKSTFDGKNWSTPENLGYPINTTDDDLHFVLSANGKNGYYTSVTKDGYGGKDIYQIKMPKNTIPLTMIRGSILCADSLKPLNVLIQVQDVVTGKFIKHIYKPNPHTGKYLVILPPGKNYDMIITSEGYIPYKMNVYIPEQKEFFELYQTIYIKALKTSTKKLGQGISVDNSFFDSEGSIVDMDNAQKENRQQHLQNLLDNIIMTSDSLSLHHLDEVIESNFEDSYTTVNINNNFNSLLQLVNEVIENTDSTALNHINNIIEKGLYTHAQNNIYFYDDPSNNSDTLVINSTGFKNASSSNDANQTYFGVIQQSELVKSATKLKPVTESIFFGSNESMVNQQYHKTLKNLIEIYQSRPNLHFVLTGHTDNIGSDTYNQLLSKKRVDSVEKFLVENKIPRNSIKRNWKGEKDPNNANNTEEERARNRRVEIKLIEN